MVLFDRSTLLLFGSSSSRNRRCLCAKGLSRLSFQYYFWGEFHTYRVVLLRCRRCADGSENELFLSYSSMACEDRLVVYYVYCTK